MSITAKAVFFAAVTVVCGVMLLWMILSAENRVHTGLSVKPYLRSAANASFVEKVSSPDHGSSRSPIPRNTSASTTAKTAPQAHCEPVMAPGGKQLSILGKRPERCLTPGGDGLYISIKTTTGNHKSRLPILVLSWLQTVRAEQVHIVTDDLSEEEEIYQATKALGMSILPTKCNASHEKSSLCCKAGEEYMQYYRITANQTEDNSTYKWFCHFDDDVYANVPNLVSALAKTGNESDDSVYFGRWPGDVVLDRLKKGIRIKEENLKKIGMEVYDKNLLMVKWATGASYCLSASLMSKMEHLFRMHTYTDYCNLIGLNDDLVPAVLAASLGYTITDNTRVKSHYDNLKSIPANQLKDLITISYHGPKTVIIPEAKVPLKQDPSRFLSYHCLLFPSTRWCNA